MQLYIFLICFSSIIAIQCQVGKTKSRVSTSDIGIEIYNTPTRGMGYTNSRGNEYGLIYITSTIKNTGVRPMDIHWDLIYERDYPSEYGDQKFKILLGPDLDSDQLSTLDSITGMMVHFSDMHPSDHHIHDLSIAAGEQSVLTIGTLFNREEAECSVVPYEVFRYSEGHDFHMCQWPDRMQRPDNPELALGLRLGYCTVGGDFRTCEIMVCGKIEESIPEASTDHK